jgi:hypothetical protein
MSPQHWSDSFFVQGRYAEELGGVSRYSRGRGRIVSRLGIVAVALAVALGLVATACGRGDGGEPANGCTRAHRRRRSFDSGNRRCAVASAHRSRFHPSSVCKCAAFWRGWRVRRGVAR